MAKNNEHSQRVKCIRRYSRILTPTDSSIGGGQGSKKRDYEEEEPVAGKWSRRNYRYRKTKRAKKAADAATIKRMRGELDASNIRSRARDVESESGQEKIAVDNFS
ncbi:hypothetical protein N7490_012202 [Penicillium lividum]|nr:hypothetical protein N7490_012202 [Penicillium lividum]